MKRSVLNAICEAEAFPEYSGILGPRIPDNNVLNASCSCLFFQIPTWKVKGDFVTLAESWRLPIQTLQDCEKRIFFFFFLSEVKIQGPGDIVQWLEHLQRKCRLELGSPEST